MIATLLNVPQTQGDWATFGFAHAEVHQAIRKALLDKLGFQTGDYILDPINPDAIDEWLGRVQQAHTEMNDALNLQSNNLQGADFTDPNQTAAWIYLNWQEDNAAMNKLGI
jgi:hypothetical protein